MEQKIVDYILQKYNPVGLVLHGSRATGHAVADSDWDFIIFTREKKNLHREVLFGRVSNFWKKLCLLLNILY